VLGFLLTVAEILLDDILSVDVVAIDLGPGGRRRRSFCRPWRSRPDFVSITAQLRLDSGFFSRESCRVSACVHISGGAGTPGGPFHGFSYGFVLGGEGRRAQYRDGAIAGKATNATARGRLATGRCGRRDYLHFRVEGRRGRGADRHHGPDGMMLAGPTNITDHAGTALTLSPAAVRNRVQGPAGSPPA
jgi:hypothetical protein